MLVFESKAGSREVYAWASNGARFGAGIPFGPKAFVIGSDACR